MAGPEGFEPSTFGLRASAAGLHVALVRRSTWLSYGPVRKPMTNPTCKIKLLCELNRKPSEPCLGSPFFEDFHEPS
jgi:hypothetical protein